MKHPKTKTLYIPNLNPCERARVDERRLIDFDRTVGGRDPCGVLSIAGQSAKDACGVCTSCIPSGFKEFFEFYA